VPSPARRPIQPSADGPFVPATPPRRPKSNAWRWALNVESPAWAGLSEDGRGGFRTCGLSRVNSRAVCTSRCRIRLYAMARARSARRAHGAGCGVIAPIRHGCGRYRHRNAARDGTAGACRRRHGPRVPLLPALAVHHAPCPASATRRSPSWTPTPPARSGSGPGARWVDGYGHEPTRGEFRRVCMTVQFLGWYRAQPAAGP